MSMTYNTPVCHAITHVYLAIARLKCVDGGVDSINRVFVCCTVMYILQHDLF